VLFIRSGIPSPAYLPEFEQKVGARDDGFGRTLCENRLSQAVKKCTAGKVGEEHLAQCRGMPWKFAADFTLVAGSLVNEALRARELRSLHAVDYQDLAALQHADSSGEAGLAGNAAKHGFGTGAETQFAKRAMRQRDHFQADFVAACVAVAREITLALEPGQNPGASTSLESAPGG
jgi:hypothetical protein